MRKHWIVLPSTGQRIEAAHGKILAHALMEHGIFIRSDCGGNGTCGKCRVRKKLESGGFQAVYACRQGVLEDLEIEIPESSLLSVFPVPKPPIQPAGESGAGQDKNRGSSGLGLAVDLGTTTISLYLCCLEDCTVVSSVAVRNPQALWGSDVMSRITAIGEKPERLGRLQGVAVSAILHGAKHLLRENAFSSKTISEILIVGNPTMMHILAGENPEPIGIHPYTPVFLDAKILDAENLGFPFPACPVRLLPQKSGFIGGDIIAAAMAVDIESQPDATLLMDLGTNGELLLKKGSRLLAASCATGPAFEGACLSCGVQALPGAVDRVWIESTYSRPRYTIISPGEPAFGKPSGICGSGVISAIAQFLKNRIITPDGAFSKHIDSEFLQEDEAGRCHYTIVSKDLSKDGPPLFVSQGDIRAVQYAKAALRCGIESLLRKARIDAPAKILLAGAFGACMYAEDMKALGMIPGIGSDRVKSTGNAAGAGAVMALCDPRFREESISLAKRIAVVDLTSEPSFQELFIDNLGFPKTLCP